MPNRLNEEFPLDQNDIPGAVRVDGDGEYYVPSKDIGSTFFRGAVENVPTAGTRVQLPSYPCMEVTIIAKEENTGSIYVGGNDVSSEVYGVKLNARDSITLKLKNTDYIHIDASVSGEGISYVTI